MKKKILIFGLIIGSSLYTANALADCAEGEILDAFTNTCLEKTGECGNGCSYLINNGNLTVRGNGSGTIDQQKFNGNRNFTNVDISGIANIGYMAFYNAGSGGGMVKIDSALESLNGPFWGDARFSTFDIDSTNFSTNFRTFNTDNITLIVPPNEKDFNALTFTNSSGGSVIRNLTVVCKGEIALCAKSMYSAISPILNNNGTANMRDAQNNSIVWEENGYALKNADGDIMSRYYQGGKIVASYAYNADGSVITTEYDNQGAFLKAYTANNDGSLSLFDENGKLIGYKNKRIYTIDEANLVAGPVNRVSIKYR